MSASGQKPFLQVTPKAHAAAAGDRSVLELLYVLSGEGTCLSAGRERAVRAGDSVLAWANTTTLSCPAAALAAAVAVTEGTSSSSTSSTSSTASISRGDPHPPQKQQQQLSALKFHLPLSIVQRQPQGTAVSGAAASSAGPSRSRSKVAAVAAAPALAHQMLPSWMELFEGHLLGSAGTPMVQHAADVGGGGGAASASWSRGGSKTAGISGTAEDGPSGILREVLTAAECKRIMASVQVRDEDGANGVQGGASRPMHPMHPMCPMCPMRPIRPLHPMCPMCPMCPKPMLPNFPPCLTACGAVKG